MTKFKVGDIVEGIHNDVAGLILEILEVHQDRYIMKTINNDNSHNRNNGDEYKIGGIFRRHTFWLTCLKLLKHKRKTLKQIYGALK